MEFQKYAQKSGDVGKGEKHKSEEDGKGENEVEIDKDNFTLIQFYIYQ